jgi:hypothetical protein
MITDSELKVRGVQALSDALGLVEAERFLSLMKKDSFDYTTWQRTLFAEMTLDELNRRAAENWERHEDAALE